MLKLVNGHQYIAHPKDEGKIKLDFIRFIIVYELISVSSDVFRKIQYIELNKYKRDLRINVFYNLQQI